MRPDAPMPDPTERARFFEAAYKELHAKHGDLVESLILQTVDGCEPAAGDGGSRCEIVNQEDPETWCWPCKIAASIQYSERKR